MDCPDVRKSATGGDNAQCEVTMWGYLKVSAITSVTACRNAPRNETKRRYFKFKQLKICELIKISIHFHFSALYACPEHS
jgi:hypothetical protein